MSISNPKYKTGDLVSLGDTNTPHAIRLTVWDNGVQKYYYRLIPEVGKSVFEDELKAWASHPLDFLRL